MKIIFEKLAQGFSLTEQESYQLITDIVHQNMNATQIAAVLTFYISRPIQLQELGGFKNALIDNCISVTLHKNAIDVCGTGGDSKNTFNISTISGLVLAASGVPVAKHGNYGSTSVTGSSDILSHLGYKFETNPDVLNEQLEKYNFCFMHAPLFHPALKGMVQHRKEIGIRTFFNLLGPLVNPANINAKYVGVFNQETARLYSYHLQNENVNYAIVHSVDGYDEVSLTAPFKLYSSMSEQIISPEELGFEVLCPADLHSGKDVKEAGQLFISVLKNESSKAQKNVVLANSAMAYCCYHPEVSRKDAISICRETIESKQAYYLLKNLTAN